MDKMIKKRCITLIEIMIVMFLIAMITGVVAYNYRGSLEEGRAFKTQQGIDKVKTILLLSIADNPSTWDEMRDKWEGYVKSSPLASNPKALVVDGWGEKYKVDPITVEGQKDVQVRSERYEAYLKAHPSLFHDAAQD